MARVAVLEANDRHTQRKLDEMVETNKSMAANVQDIRDAVLSANLTELPKRVANLEKSRWISYGASGGIGGGTVYFLMKVLATLGIIKL